MDTSSHFYLLITSLLLLHCFIDYSSAISDINTDRSSLLALKSQITLDPQNVLTQNWSTEASVCSWIGVTCDSRYNRVTQLNISYMGLVGSLPPEIGNLSSLISLEANENSFHGPIPPSLFNLSSIEILNLRNNSLSGRLPDLDMCKHNNLDRLKILRFSYNELYGEIPSSLGQCSQLEFLSLYNNNFTGFVPREIGSLTKLQVLNLGANSLSGNIPKEIAALNNLQALDMSSNNFIGPVPREIGNLTMLQLLDLSTNKFSAAHTVGFSHCDRFANRIYNFSKQNPVDPTLNAEYATQLQGMCPRNVDPRVAINMDPTTPRSFDNAYFKNLVQGKGLFTSDQVLFTDSRSKNTVSTWASNPQALNAAFIQAITKLGRVGVKTEKTGNIRFDCGRFN